MWKAKNNKYYRGRTDRIAVSITESCDIDEFIAGFLHGNGVPDTDSNRQRIATAMTKYPGACAVAAA